ncbi:MAG: hypothetical protein QOF49_1005 [Chloroflexota bacterium]|nr:hypothetical protein [Chloroflexota bacterium]
MRFARRGRRLLGWTTTRDLRVVDGAFVVLVAIGCLFILWLGRSSTFRIDDWLFAAEQPPPSVDYLLVPHNEHWSTLMKLPFQLLYAAFGLRTYLPYLGLLLVAHAATTLAVYALISAVAGRVLAVAVGCTVLFLGSAHENLFWFASIGFQISISTGVVALWILVTRPLTTRVTAAIAIMLVLSLMSSGAGLAFVAGLGLATLLDPARRAAWWAPVTAGAIYVAWYAIWGRSSVAPVAIESVSELPGFIYAGATNGVALASGLGRGIGSVIAVVGVGAVWLLVATGRRPTTAAIAGAVGVVTFLAIAGLVRVDRPLGSEMAAAPRYITTTAVLFAITIAGLLGRPRDRSAAGLRALALIPIVAVALIGNGRALVIAGERYATEATDRRAALGIWAAMTDAPAVRDSKHLPLAAATLTRVAAIGGLPTQDELRPTVILPITSAIRDRALFSLVRDDLVVAAAVPEVREPAAVHGVEGTFHATSSPAAAGCLEDRAAGPDNLAWFRIPSGGSFRVVPRGSGQLTIHLAREADFQPAASSHYPVMTSVPYRVTVPDLGDRPPWRVAVHLGAGIDAATIC